ncbi:chromosomal replication initiator protein DnaA [Vaginisenegalia massiliensis]|uniref:chromosomal replication initiator protein DnaA n=1 Tax=Vaginisenegalia massiliensis TaxID=2058294 RepID=UPI000F5360C7|nr:chromosomal replication initiator protein DnaA [Vaginisenegalia massiliensis]
MDEKDVFWQGLVQYLKEVLSDTTFNNWVVPVKPRRIANQSISLIVPNSFIKSYWERHLSGYILQFSLEKYGVEFQPTFTILPDKTELEEKLEQKSEQNKLIENDIFINSHLNPNYTFENFVIGEDNKMANGAALAVCDGPGKTYNPFLIYGGVGLGKTHLMQAIGNEIHRKNPQAKIKYATSESFMNDFINAISNGSQKEFREMYRNIDVLLIDDIQFLSNKDKTQEEFFHTFNALYNNEKQIVLTSDRLPNNIDNLEERLISRFKWGLSTDITPPDLETRIAILRKKASKDHLDINSETLTYIANNIDTNIRELEGALVRVIAFAAIKGKEINSNLAAEALQSIVGSNEKKALTIDEIIQEVSRYYQVSVAEIKGKKRTKEIVYPRQIAMFLARELTDISFPKIGEDFGNKNHTTVIHAYEKINDSRLIDAKLKEELQQLTDRLKN